MHCSGIKESLLKSQNFVCSRCNTAVKDQALCTGLEIGNGVVLERVGSFRYLGYMPDEEGGVERAVIARIGVGWSKFRALTPLMCAKSTPMVLRGKLYSTCVTSCMVYGSETWALTVENQRRLERAERQMLKTICGVH
jgi:hypothetical protein